MMGLKEAWSKVTGGKGGSSKKVSLPPMTIQQVEQLLSLRLASAHPSKTINLIVEGESYVIMDSFEHERIMRVVESVEKMIGQIQKEDA